MSKRLLSLFSLWHTTVSIAHASEVHARRGVFDVMPPLETGQVGEPEDYPQYVPRLARQKRSPLQPGDQFVFAICPERLGKSPKHCDRCGGDSKVHGVCNNILVTGSMYANADCRGSGRNCHGYYCQCTHEGQDHNPQVTASAVVDGQTGTVVFEPVTVSEYEKLRHKTSVTITEVATATESDAGSSIQTAVAVIFAGGITWVAISQSGGAAAIAAIKPPADAPEDAKNDDPSCKTDPEEECSKCGGSDGVGLCSSGDQAGCPCEETQNCPNEPPRCSDEQCGGDNGNSQCAASGEINGCLCCPDEISCTHDDCKGNPLQHCTSDKLNECGCLVEADDGAVDITENIPGIQDRAERSSSLSVIGNYVFTTVWGGKYDNVPGYAEPTKKPSDPCETQTVEVPGKCGVPACQHVLAKRKGVAALCEEDYCFCDGVAVELLTSVVEGSTSLGCGYQTLPTKKSCPSKTAAPPSPTKTPKINKPGNRERCYNNGDCEKFTCNDKGRKATCNYDIDIPNAWCRC